jgi:hypothetical protein
MDARRGDRPSQVRPRPPTSSRPAPLRTRSVTPSPARLAGYRRIERRRGIPLPLKAVLAATIALLGLVIVMLVAGQVGPFVSSVVKGFGGFISQIGVAVASPAVTEAPLVPDAPTIEPPDSPYTNEDTVDITVNVPTTVTGKAGYTVRLYVTLPDKDPEVIAEAPVGKTAVQVLTDIKLAVGRNDIEAAIAGPGGESEHSAISTWVLDQSKPKVSVISPKNNAQIAKDKDKVTIKGKSQPRAEIRVQNTANGAVATTKASKDGLWTVVIALDNGPNAITVTAVDPAGNTNTTTLNLRKGSGKLTAVLTGSAYRFKASKLPRKITLEVVVSDANGRKLKGATALFTISVPGIEAIVSGEVQTDAQGHAAFTTNIPSGAMAGSGLATVLITTDNGGTVTDRQVLTITE